MATKQRAVDVGNDRARMLRAAAGREIRDARTGLGLSLATVSRAARMSEAHASRIERGLLAHVSVSDLAKLNAVVGLELSLRSYPGGRPVRDGAHVELLDDLRARSHRSLRWAVEVPLPIHGDPRAWDAVVRGSTFCYAVEAETAPRDAQALTRRIHAKQRDSHVDGVILLVRMTLQTRRFLRDAGDWLRSAFPVDGGRALELLAAGVAPGGSALIALPQRRRADPTARGPDRRGSP